MMASSIGHGCPSPPTTRKTARLYFTARRETAAQKRAKRYPGKSGRRTIRDARVAWRIGRRTSGSKVSIGKARRFEFATASAPVRAWIANQCISTLVVISGRLLRNGEITRSDAVKYLAVGRWLFLEETPFDELGDRLCNFRRPLLDVRVEHPPMKDAVDGVLCIRMPGQIIENFWRRRWKRRVDKHALGTSVVPS